MKKMILMLAVLISFVSGCSKQPAELPSPTASLPGSSSAQEQVEIVLTFSHRSGIASNQYAVWIENNDGDFIRTLYATRFTADGGWKNRPEALPIWIERSGMRAGTAQAADAYSGATPKSGQQTYLWDCNDESGQAVPAGEYHFIVEGTIFWEDAVLYSGVINVNGEENTAQAEAEYTTEKAKLSDMITGVEAVYRP